MEFRILGPLEVVADGQKVTVRSGQQRALLAFLLLNANHVVSADRICDELWADELPGSGTKALAFHVSRLRDSLAPGRKATGGIACLETEPGGYVLRADPDSIDAVHFERLVSSAHAQLADEPELARARLDEALGLWRGEALADVAYANFAQSEIERLEELRFVAAEDRIEADLALGAEQAAIAQLEPLVGLHPLREHLRCLLMLALYRCGRQAEALRVAGAGRRLLSEELGIDPSPELVELERQILAHDPTLALGSPPARNPYKGLRAYTEADSADFFGREELIRRLLARVEEAENGNRLIAVVGPSGSGKSSAVRAGLIPALRAQGAANGLKLHIVTVVPGSDPPAELAAALHSVGYPKRPGGHTSKPLRQWLAGARSDAPLVVFIDQFEELFVRSTTAARDLFIDDLVAALRTPGAPLVLVIALRADFLHLPLQRPGLGDLMRGSVELVTPMSRADLERAILEPARAVGSRLEPGLAAEIAAEIEHQPAALPLLQYALTELYDRTGGRELTRADYSAIGGASGAVRRRADEIWLSLGDTHRDLAQQVMLRLVELGDGGMPTSRRANRAELEALVTATDRPALNAVIAEFGRCRLLTFDHDRLGHPTVEIAHEALLTEWTRLAGWIDEAREDLWTRRRLADAVSEWEAADHAVDFLLGGVRLERFEAWQSATKMQLTSDERAYLAASAAERQRRLRGEADRLARETSLERRSRSTRRVLTVVVAGGLMIASVLTAALLSDQQSAAEQRDISTARELAAGSVASLDTNRQLSVLLAVDAANATAARGYVVEEAYDALQWAIQGARLPFPTGSLPVGVRSAPGGARGVFLVAPETLMGLAFDYAHRGLTAEECRAYLHRDYCPPPARPADGAPLGVHTGAGVVEAADLAYGPLVGTSVRVLSELPVDLTVAVDSRAADVGIEVEWSATHDGDLSASLGDDVPDLAFVARPAEVVAAGRDGPVIDLEGRISSAATGSTASSYVMGLTEVTSPGGGTVQHWGLPLAASVEDLLWYPRAAFEASGYRPPATADDLDQIVADLTRDGHQRWCFGTVGDRPGDAAAAWVETLVLRDEGLDYFDSWVAGSTKFSDQGVEDAVESMGRYLGGEGSVFNGLDAADRTPERTAALPMTLPDGPQCWLYRGSSTDRLFPPGLGPTAAEIPFPSAADRDGPVLGRVYSLVMLSDRPEVRSLAEALVASEFRREISTELCSSGLFPVTDQEVPADCVAVADATRLRDALRDGAFRVRPADVMPVVVADAFRGDVGSYLWGLRFGATTVNGMEFGADYAWASYRAGLTP